MAPINNYNHSEVRNMITHTENCGVHLLFNILILDKLPLIVTLS